MARFIADGMIYDTDKATVVLIRGEVSEFNKRNYLIDEGVETLYVTNKGNWFSVYTIDGEVAETRTKTDDEVKELLCDMNEIDIYEKYFGKLEEA